MSISWVNVPDFDKNFFSPSQLHLAAPLGRLMDSLSASDRRELEAAGHGPEVIYKARDLNLGFIDGRLECVFGFEGVQGDEHNGFRPYLIPWLLGSGNYGVGLRRRQFLKTAKGIVDRIESPMCNVVLATSLNAQRFIEFCGFTIHRDHPMVLGPDGQTFYGFSKNV